jgi:hypothetical protein
MAPLRQDSLRHHCEEPTGRANARPLMGSAMMQSTLSFRGKMDCFAYARNDDGNGGCLPPEHAGGSKCGW